MDGKIKLIILGIVLVLSVLGLSYLVFAEAIMVNVVYPATEPSVNVSTNYYYINVSLNGSANTVYLEWWNVTNTSAFTGSWVNITMLNVSGASSKHFYYNITTALDLGLSETNYNYTIYAKNDTTWNKSTVERVTFDYINPTKPTALAQNAQTITSFNGTPNVFVTMNFTFYDVNPANCTIDFANVTTRSNYTMTRTSNIVTGYTYCFFNDTVNGNSSYGEKFNYTIYATDAASHVSSTGLYFITVDNVAPLVTKVVNVQYNDSTNKMINMTFVVADNHTQSVGVNIYQDDGSKKYKNANAMNATGEMMLYQVQINTSDITQDGDLVIEPFANDTAGNNGYGTNLTLLSSLLKSGWNFIVNSDMNRTTYALCNDIPTCTAISRFNNTQNLSVINDTLGVDANFINYAKATVSVNNASVIDYGEAYWINVASDTLYLRNTTYINQVAGIQAKENMTLNPYNYTYNYSVNVTGGWNAVGIYVERTANATMKMHANITEIAYYNASDGYYYHCWKDWELCTGEFNATTLSWPKSFGVWLYVNSTAIINRSIAYSM